MYSQPSASSPQPGVVSPLQSCSPSEPDVESAHQVTGDMMGGSGEPEGGSGGPTPAIQDMLGKMNLTEEVEEAAVEEEEQQHQKEEKKQGEAVEEDGEEEDAKDDEEDAIETEETEEEEEVQVAAVEEEEEEEEEVTLADITRGLAAADEEEEEEEKMPASCIKESTLASGRHRFCAKIYLRDVVPPKFKTLGTFDTREEAEATYRRAAAGDFAVERNMPPSAITETTTASGRQRFGATFDLRGVVPQKLIHLGRAVQVDPINPL